MSVRLTRMVVVLAGLLGLVGVHVPPASATTAKGIVFVLEMHLTDGLSYPCASSGTFNPSKCPAGASVTTWPLPRHGGNSTLLDAVPNPRVTGLGGNTRHHGFDTVAGMCATTGVNVLKEGKEPTHGAELCSISGSGILTGHCGLAESNGAADIVILGQVYTLFFHYTQIAGHLVITGHVYKPWPGIWGKFYGNGRSVEIPETTFPTISNSCSHKTADVFTVSGEGVIVIATI